ncbi:MAG: hypothetical protein Q8P79_00780 [Nanoarchaeota archaeon]|nr:hypothetical protein [Nanoarchaeota archaeon]
MQPEEITYKCEPCNRNFGSSEALDMHNRAKHSNLQPEQKISKTNYKKIRNWGVFILILGLAVWGIYMLISNGNSFTNLPASQINIGGHQNIALHIHSNLKIMIDGQENLIPANIGIEPGIMRPLHTHDSSGEIHIEGPYKRDFTLGEFFEIWNQKFNSECVFEYCTDAENNATLKMLVNGRENTGFGNYVLRDGDDIIIEYIS